MSSDDEQLEELKSWWRKYGKPIIAGLVIGLGATLGTRAWINQQEQALFSASAEYEQMQMELMIGNEEAVLTRGDHLIDNYARTPYAVLAAFALASVHVEQGDLPAARERLQWAMDHAGTPEKTHLARLRLARVIAADGQADQALALLQGVEPGAFTASYEELKGDLYVETGQAEQARQAYLRAIDALAFGAGAELVQMKLDDLGLEEPGAEG